MKKSCKSLIVSRLMKERKEEEKKIESMHIPGVKLKTITFFNFCNAS